MYKTLIKPIFDRSVGLFGIIFLSPLILFLILVLGVHFKGNPFFLQERIGKDNNVFTIVKFRTMNTRKDNLGILLPDSKRLTSIGRFLRKFSLDELPQLWNLLKGEMSLVGPRPLLVEYLPLYSSEQVKRHWVKPGITGLAQVKGRNMISWEEKFNYDVMYVNRQSLKLDLWIVILSFIQIFNTKEIYGEGGIVKKFEGKRYK
ncbi:sugar transferase [Echinicola jeungdonensis]|uniref:Sugar transferase n=1 Tax=Echinicola jeungdonensis TaxID=709343 RepID=A0ABV5J930_9BACT|nr:sugar transferase [Echinicola jeungdonensis]MDN3669933.1 sugar transferase [Echinicola jeungdonensis]